MRLLVMELNIAIKDMGEVPDPPAEAFVATNQPLDQMDKAEKILEKSLKIIYPSSIGQNFPVRLVSMSEAYEIAADHFETAFDAMARMRAVAQTMGTPSERQATPRFPFAG